MNYKALALGAALGLLFALTPSCGPKKCDATNCAGCCDTAGTCQAATNATCGASGNACAVCTGSQTCSGGVCTNTGGGVGGGAGGGTGGDCKAQGLCTKSVGGCGDPCASGCCLPNDPFGRCSTAASNGVCGKNTDVCAACTSTQTCVSVTGGSECSAGTGGGSGGGTGVDAGIGTMCATNTDCGANFYCKTMTNTLLDGGTYAAKPDGGAVTGHEYKDGYCTKRCTSSTQCGVGNYCLPAIPGGVSGESERICLTGCDPAATTAPCRDGYSCLSTSATAGMCFVDPDYATGVIGSACTSYLECGDNWTSSCIPATTSSGAQTGFPGGYCTADCSSSTTQTYCGSKAFCVGFSGGGAECFEQCTNPDGGAVAELTGQGTCTRTDHVCWGGFTDPRLGMCVGNCKLQPSTCGAGSACVDDGGVNDGYCCVTDGGTNCGAAGFN